MSEDCTLPGPARLPVEICERVIESIYDERFYRVSDALAALSRCSLVCRAWRPRAQTMLFTYVLLKDKDMLHRFAALLDRAPHLGRYVRTLSLRGHHHRPDSTVVLFPTVLRNRLPSLVRLSIAQEQAVDSAQLSDKVVSSTDKKPPPCLPLHPRYPLLIAHFAHVRELNLSHTTFPSFGDLCRTLDTLTSLREILALSVSYIVLGLQPQCVLRNLDGYSGRPKRFLPKLRALLCYDMDDAGAQRLTAALAPSLLKLWLKFPNEPTLWKVVGPVLRDDSHEALVGLDLQHCTVLVHLGFRLGQELREDAAALEALRATLLSWATLIDSLSTTNRFQSRHNRYLHLGAWWRRAFSRHEYVSLLRTLGAIVEDTAVVRRDPGRRGLLTHPRRA
ncbi:hypothetical protein C8T65DRAFT_237554 [Cerioporus squamosus]|nr:hypothetical protein C8T65DRAFT_237554 [Cerioporus squamosus]